MCSRFPTCGKIDASLSNFTRTHAWVSQKSRDDTHGVSGCDAGRQRDETATKTGNSDCVSKRRCEGMVFEHCSSTTIEPRRWQKTVQLSLAIHMLWVPKGLFVGIVGFALEVRAESSAQYNSSQCFIVCRSSVFDDVSWATCVSHW